MATPGYCWRRSNGMLLFGLTTAFLFANGSDLRRAAIVLFGDNQEA
jgi:hypothetical protein